MKTQKRIFMATMFISLFFCGIIVFWGSQAIGQEWTAEQKEVWGKVQARWEAIKSGDVEAALALLHDDFTIWLENYTLTSDKKYIKRDWDKWVSYSKPKTYGLKPIDIQIINNVANVFYAFKHKGEVRGGEGKNLESFIKQDNKWLQISSYGCMCDKPPTCNFDW